MTDRDRLLESLREMQQASDLIDGIKGEFYPCKPDIFKATYEPV